MRTYAVSHVIQHFKDFLSFTYALQCTYVLRNSIAILQENTSILQYLYHIRK